MKGLVFGIVLASVGVAAMAGGAVARNVGGHGGHGGAGPAWPTPTVSPTKPPCPAVAGASCCVTIVGGSGVTPAC